MLTTFFLDQISFSGDLHSNSFGSLFLPLAYRMAAAVAGAGDLPPDGGNDGHNPEDAPEEGEESENPDEEEAPEDAPAPDNLFALNLGNSKVSESIHRLKREREENRKKTITASKELKKHKRKQARLRNKAQKLDNNDLMEVFRLRSEAMAKAKAKAKGAAAAAPKAKAKAKAGP